jgi:hypothetical protein
MPHAKDIIGNSCKKPLNRSLSCVKMNKLEMKRENDKELRWKPSPLPPKNKWKDYWQISIKNLRPEKKRSWLMQL